MPKNRPTGAAKPIEEMAAGDKLPDIECTITPPMVSAYLEAVEASSTSPPVVPPVALLAYVLRQMLALLGLPPGTTHLAQELEVTYPIPFNSPIACRSQIAKRSRHAGLELVQIRLEAVSFEGKTLLTGLTTLALPQQASSRDAD